MLSDHIGSAIVTHFKETPTKGQEELIRLLSEFVVSSGRRDLFLIRGYAGTGKTSVIAAFVAAIRMLKIRSVLLAPTGRAAKVMSSFTHSPAFTIHKKIYRQKSSKDGFGNFSLNVNLHTDAYFIVDEASMIANMSNEQNIFGSGQLLNDLLEFCLLYTSSSDTL